MKKIFIISAVCLLSLCGCGRIPKLANGEEAVVTFKKDDKEHSISANDIYEVLKKEYGLSITTDLIDKYIFETEFADYTDDALEEAENTVEAMITYYGGEDALLAFMENYTKFPSIDAYKDYVYVESLRSHAIDAYAKLQVTDKDIENYYNKEAKGDIEVYHILVVPKVTDSMTSDEKKEAEAKAKATVDEILKKLKDSKDVLTTFKELVKEYSEDESTKSKDGNLGDINYYVLGHEYDELVDAAYKLKDGEYSKEMVTTELGYHVIYRNATREKDTLENLKSKITEILADREIEEDSKIRIHTLKYYRDLYNMDIVDSDLDSEYGINLNAELNAKEDTAE